MAEHLQPEADLEEVAAGVVGGVGEAVLVVGLAGELVAAAADVEESDVGVEVESVAADFETVIEAVDTEASALVVVNEADLDAAENGLGIQHMAEIEVGFAPGGEPVTAFELDAAQQHGVDVVG